MTKILEAFIQALLLSVEETCKDAITAALAENAGQPRYPEFVAADQAAEITGYSKNSIYQMNHQGRVPGARKIGGKLMFETAVLREWVRSGATPKAD
jgi:predicted DNA-binding transcriptional regulator AlpA